MSPSISERRIWSRRLAAPITTVQFLENTLTVTSIMQPMKPVPYGTKVNELLTRMTLSNFDHTVVMDRNSAFSYVSRQDLEGSDPQAPALDCSHPIFASNLIADTCPLVEALPRIINDEFLFVLMGKSIDHIVTAADLERPPIAMYFASVLREFEESLAAVIGTLTDSQVKSFMDRWIASVEGDEKWIGEESRLLGSIYVFEQKRANHQEIKLVNCLSLQQKIRLFALTHPSSREMFGYEDAQDGVVNMSKMDALRNYIVNRNVIATSAEEWKDALATIREAKRLTACLNEAMR